jgi:ribosomal-protein-alanine N-acetyltransferase
MRILHTSIGTLEPQLSAHAAEMFVVLSDPAIYEFENSPPASEAWLTERFTRLEAMKSKDGSEVWLNWVIRLPTGELAGYMQATIMRAQTAYIAYELSSKYWRRGIGSSAVRAMQGELVAHYGVLSLVAVLKARNFRSHSLLSSLGFKPGSSEQIIMFGAEQDEATMVKDVRGAENVA